MDRWRSDKWHVLDARLRESADIGLDAFIEEARSAEVSWLDIAFEVRQKTGRKVSPASLMIWYDKDGSPKVAAAS